MRKRSWISDISIAFLTQLGALMASCGGSDVDPGTSGGSGGDAAMSGSGGDSASAAGGSGGTGGATPIGDGETGGAASGGGPAEGAGGTPSRELCGIGLVGECVDGVVQVMVGTQCTVWTVECPGQCREDLENLPMPDRWYDPTPQDVEEVICEPDEGPGGAAGSGSTP